MFLVTLCYATYVGTKCSTNPPLSLSFYLIRSLVGLINVSSCQLTIFHSILIQRPEAGSLNIYVLVKKQGEQIHSYHQYEFGHT